VTGDHDTPGGAEAARRRLRGFGLHLAGYFATVVALFGFGAVFAPGADWILVPVVGWGAVLAIHAAYAMGLFEVFKGPK